jgi:hypothetical protein
MGDKFDDMLIANELMTLIIEKLKVRTSPEYGLRGLM